MMEEKVSIIIPCYNHGKYIHEAIASVEECDPSMYELIIVNDGSTDSYTIQVMDELSSKGYHVVNQKNQGLAASRNNGIKLAKGKYILPLDADNRIRKEYVSYSLEYFRSHAEIDVVYGDAQYFGDKNGRSYLPDFNLQRMMILNYIDACAVYRKSIWDKLGGYDENMPYMGIEDWEFWLRVAFSGGKFHHVAAVMYDYRVLKNSMITKDTKPNFIALKKYMEEKHSQWLNADAIGDYMSDKFKANPLFFIGKFILRSYFSSVYSKLVENGKLRKL